MNDEQREIDRLRVEACEMQASAYKTIETEMDCETAKEYVVALRKKGRDVASFFSNLLKPIEAVVTSRKALMKETLAPLEQAEKQVIQAINTYETAYKARIAKEQEEQAKQLEQAMINNHGILPTIEPIQARAKTSDTSSGSYTTKTVKVLTIHDERLIPEPYWVVTRTLNKKMVEAALKGGVNVPGAEMVETIQSAITVT